MNVTSCTKYFCAILFALVAVLIAFLVQISSKPENIVIDLSPSSPSQSEVFSPAQLELNEEQISNFRRDGVLLVRGLLTPDETATIRTGAEQKAANAPFGIFDLFRSNYGKVVFDLWRTDETFARLALQALPAVASQLMLDGDTETGNIRLLRDAFFSYNSGGKGCGWHVDDEGFWPAKNDTSGVTIWIALDEMKVSEGGGLAVANRTHIVDNEGQEWIRECREVIKGKTCNMETESPECQNRMERIKLQWDMNAGDALLWDRWSFHRGVPSVVQKDDDQEEEERKKKLRYSVRYMPSNARAFGAVHHTVEQDSYFDSPYYPQVWPDLMDKETQALKQGLDGDVTPVNIFKTLGSVLVKNIRGHFRRS